MTVVCAGGQVNRIGLGSMDVGPVAALSCYTASSLRRQARQVGGRSGLPAGGRW